MTLSRCSTIGNALTRHLMAAYSGNKWQKWDKVFVRGRLPSPMPVGNDLSYWASLHTPGAHTGVAGDSASRRGMATATLAATRLPMFRGVTHLSLDAMGRLAAPRGIGTRCCLQAADAWCSLPTRRCLLVYPPSPRPGSIVAVDGVVPAQRKIRACNASSSATPTTSSRWVRARILVPPALRALREFDKHVVLVGQGHRFELWGHAQWQAQTALAIGSTPAALPPELDGFLALMADGEHVPVLLEEAVAALSISPAAVVRRRHLRPRRPRATRSSPPWPPGASSLSTAILPPKRRRMRIADARFMFRRAWFSAVAGRLSRRSRLAPSTASCSIFGVSSPQLDDADARLLFRHDGPLDMRMDPTRGESAADFLARARACAN